MKAIHCLHCQSLFTPRNRKQKYCSSTECQRARKTLWQKEKIASDPEYRKGQKLSQNKWLGDNPDYYKKYRQKNPDKAQRNRLLQKIRNQKRRNVDALQSGPASLKIAKMDVRNSNVGLACGEYLLVPMIAKMDAIKIFITTKPVSWE